MVLEVDESDPFISDWEYDECDLTGSANANRRGTKNSLGQVFHFKLGSFADLKEVHGATAPPYLKLLRAQVCPGIDASTF